MISHTFKGSLRDVMKATHNQFNCKLTVNINNKNLYFFSLDFFPIFFSCHHIHIGILLYNIKIILLKNYNQ